MSSAPDDPSERSDEHAKLPGVPDRRDRDDSPEPGVTAPADAAPAGELRGSASEPAVEPDDLTGRTIGGRYTIDGVLGTGASGRTFRARRATDGQQVALKLLHGRLRSDETFKRRLHRDVEAAKKLEHLHIARTFEQGVDEQYGPFICRELIDGEDLVSALQRPALTPRRLCELLIQVLSALSEAQRHGVLHRNLKPQNVFVTRDLSPARGATADFDPAAQATAAVTPAAPVPPEDARAAPERLFCKVCDFGNPQRARLGAEYMAPEQADGQAVDGQVDIYSVGVLLYELLTGEVPFRGATPADTLALMRTERLVAPRERRPDRPPPRELEAVCLKALALDPLQRHRSPREMSQALRAVVSLLGLRADVPLGSASFGEGGGVVADTASGDRMTMPGEQMRSHTKFWVGSALLTGVCVAVLLNPVTEQDPSSPQATSALDSAQENGRTALGEGARKLSEGDAKGSIVDLRNARRALGDTPEVLRALGEALIIDGEHEEGSQLLTHYLELEPAAGDRAFVKSLLRRAAHTP
jgi:serine/threonine-protein kinase